MKVIEKWKKHLCTFCGSTRSRAQVCLSNSLLATASSRSLVLLDIFFLTLIHCTVHINTDCNYFFKDSDSQNFESATTFSCCRKPDNQKFIRISNFWLQGARTTITYLMTFLVKLQPIDEDLECKILKKLIGVLTHKTLESSMEQINTLASTSTLQSASAQDLRASTNSLTEMKELEKFGIFR